ncbi:NACHT domain-containing protein [[Limnothrix rosea] IAM M-220]|uniref:NACHT domain-containing protein n=1 Tax=[Limnothrix rosea] IAM M-220 TaxID=454133 RepID=UPI00095F852F|nr:NACHT domain-containing protein [[Limnothrix rosea] IAM M-220]OKH14665.1 signal transduction protein [[Limnothrix rosea] IAM M-220]
MPKQSYGAIPKGRSRSLLFALLDFANDSLDADEEQIDRLRSQIETQWQSSERLVVRTKLRYLQTLSRLATPDIPLTLPQIKTALKHFTNFLEILEDNRTITRGSENWHFTLTFWGDRWDREYNLGCFERVWESRRSGGVAPEKTLISGVEKKGDRRNWYRICRDGLNTRLTSNPLTAGDGMEFDLGDLYVPLGVVKNSFSDSNAEEEIEFISYTPQSFVENYRGSTEPQRFAIIGEPGTGKTTFLQQLALHLSDTEICLPVWISLADLEGRSLEDYLTTTWLRKVLKQFIIEPEILHEFVGLIAQGRVWLLLDALDEMGDTSSRAAANLERECQGWLGNAHIVLTCRNTVWHSGKNALAYFESYRCQSFGADNNQISCFVRQWFQHNLPLGDRLLEELYRAVNHRIHSVVAHPLYLTLLCRIWQLTQGKLPTTKAILYRQFVTAFYEWKQDAFPTTRIQQKNLNQALAQLALQGMQDYPQRFRFRQREIEQCFDRINPDLLTLALQLGWLDVVGHSETTGEKIYGFYHQTFQEYFAATAIAQWQDFIQLDINGKIYRPIFDYSWQEIILLWLGREDIATAEKEDFLEILWTWQDACGGFYDLKAICLVGKGLAEFSDFSRAKAVIQTLVQWRFETPQNAPILPTPIVEQAGIALSRSDRQLTVPALETFLDQTENPFDQWLAAHSLGKNHDPANKKAIATLEKLLQKDIDVSVKLNLCRSLGLIEPNNETVLQTLTHLLKTESNISILRKAALRLGRLQPNHPLAVQTLERLLEKATDTHQRGNILDTLALIAPQNTAVETHVKPTITKAKSPRAKSRKIKQKSPKELQFATETILRKLEADLPLHKRISLIVKLSNYDPPHPIIIPSLIEGLAIARRKATLKLIVETLDNLVATSQLPEILPPIRDIYLNPKTPAPGQRACYKLLWEWSKELDYDKFLHLWHLKN